MDFPRLSSGAVVQYGSTAGYNWPCQVIRFIDGADQRFLARGRMLRRWRVDLQLLNESEVAAIEQFFGGISGELSTFDFPDPISGTVVPNCRVGTGDLTTEYQDVDIAAASLWVVETNG
jgi:hypothetical protein